MVSSNLYGSLMLFMLNQNSSPFFQSQSGGCFPPCQSGYFCSWNTASSPGCYICTLASSKWRLKRADQKQDINNWKSSVMSADVVLRSGECHWLTCGFQVVSFVGMFVQEEVVPGRIFWDSLWQVLHFCWLSVAQVNHLSFSIYLLQEEEEVKVTLHKKAKVWYNI